uniref:Uncharacterized protein n=1 Tax=Oryza barthii TaxID=65489 RepID=A0A0D3FSL0_9ORYZ
MASTQRDTRPRRWRGERRPVTWTKGRGWRPWGFLRTVWDMNLSAWENGDEVVVGVVIGHAEALGGAAERRSGDRREVKLDAVAELGRQLLERLHAARGSLGGGCAARGMTVVLSIHQPSSRLLSAVDSLLLLLSRWAVMHHCSIDSLDAVLLS